MPSKYIKKTNRSVRSPEDVLEKATKLINEEGFLIETKLLKMRSTRLEFRSY